MPPGYYIIILAAAAFGALVFGMPALLKGLGRLFARLCTRVGY